MLLPLLLLLIMAVGYRGRGLGVCVVSILTLLGVFLFGCGGIYMPGVISWVAFGVLVLTALICCDKGKGNAFFDRTALTATLTVYAGAALLHLPTYFAHRALAEQTPVVDVSGRLAYEATTSAGEFASQTGPRSRMEDWSAIHRRSSLSRRVEALDPERASFDHEQARRRRIESLRALEHFHHGFVADFAAAPGFGQGRMSFRPLRTEDVPLSELPSLELPPASPDSPSGSAADLAGRPRAENEPVAAAPPASTPPAFDPLQGLHLAGVLDFVNEAGFGYVESRRRVIGFQSHGFREVPEVKVASDGTRWQVVQLELVSLLKHNPPAVYVSKHLPRMEELRDAPTRPLDGFESDALEKLRAGEELDVELSADELRMLGPLRAFEECRQCHQVRAEALLGAFTYRLRPVNGGGAPRKPRPAAQGETL